MGIFKKLEMLENKIEEMKSDFKQRIDILEEKIERTDSDFNKRLVIVEENVRNSNKQLEAFRVELNQHTNMTGTLTEQNSNIEENLRNNNAEIQAFRGQIAEFKAEAAAANIKLDQYSRQLVKKMSEGVKAPNIESIDKVSKEPLETPYKSIDYFDFENHFRGSREHIKTVQEQYLKYFIDKKHVIDLGCGRGEFLELLRENNIPATGVDSYDEFVQYCRINELDAVQGDAIEYLKNQKNIGGIFAGQLIEHLAEDQIISLCHLAYEALDNGGVMIMETPNPTSLAIYTHAFYIDPSHTKPVHPLTVQYYLEKAGFSKIEILYTESSRLPIEIPPISGANIDNLQEFNESMKCVSDTLFGSQDYAIVGYKQ